MIGSNPVVEHLVARGIKVTRANYIAFAYPEDSPELDAESEAIVREALTHYRAARSAAKVIRRARRRT